MIELLNHIPAAPEVVLLIGTCAIMIADLHVTDEGRRATYIAAQVLLGVCTLLTLFVMSQAPQGRYYLFNGLFVADALGNLLKLVCYLAVSVTLVYSRTYLLERRLMRAEFLTLLLFSLLGMMVLISANSFLTVYLGLELMSLCLYAMVALNRDSAASTEAAMKYFVLGALSSGLLLYGMSMLYGATGSLDFREISAQTKILLSAGPEAVSMRSFLVFGLVFVVAGTAFK